MSEEEKLTKKQKIEDNRRLRAMSQSLNLLTTSNRTRRTIRRNSVTEPLADDGDDSNDYKYLLNDGHRDLLAKVEEHYTDAVRLNVAAMKAADQPRLRNLNSVVNVVNEPGQMSALRMITFFKLTSEFNVSSHGLLEIILVTDGCSRLGFARRRSLGTGQAQYDIHSLHPFLHLHEHGHRDLSRAGRIG